MCGAQGGLPTARAKKTVQDNHLIRPRSQVSIHHLWKRNGYHICMQMHIISIHAFYHISYCLHLYTFQLCFFRDVFGHKITYRGTVAPRGPATKLHHATHPRRLRCHAPQWRWYLRPNEMQIKTKASWWFQPIWKIFYSQIGSFPQVEVKIKNVWNHHLGR